MLNTYGDARALLSFGSVMRMNCVLFVIYLVVSAISSLVGAAVASRYAVQLSESKLSFCVSALMLLIGALNVCWQKLIE